MAYTYNYDLFIRILEYINELYFNEIEKLIIFFNKQE